MQAHHVLAVRGAKKKKGGEIAPPTCKDLVNIWKERSDTLIYPSDMYPPWLMQMLDEKYTPDDIMLQIYRGERMPTAKEQWTLAKSLRRTQLKDRNALKTQMWEYESDEEIGEDLGILAPEAGDLDQVAAGELDAASGGEKKAVDPKAAEGGEAVEKGGEKKKASA